MRAAGWKALANDPDSIVAAPVSIAQAAGVDPVRCFIALALPADVEAVLARARETLMSEPWADLVRWVPDENLHVTLHFLGELPVERLAGVAPLLRETAQDLSPPACSLDRVTAFPSPTRARVVVTELRETDPAHPLQHGVARLGDALAALGIPGERRRFRPHVTLGRVRRPPLRGARVELALTETRFTFRELVLLRSELRPDGARYTALETVRLD